MKIVMIRHPVTIANIQGRVHQQIKGEISPRGYEQLKRLLVRLKDEHFDKIYSSDSYRCQELADTVARYKQIPVVYSSVFREIDNGVLNGAKKEDVNRLNWSDPLNTRPENGESIQDLVSRAKQGTDFLRDQGGNRNLLISHAWFLKAFLGLQLGLHPLDSIKKLKFSNCAISEVGISENGFLIEYLNNRDYLR